MSDTTDQMSLLDAIGLPAPEENKKTDKKPRTAAEKPTVKSRKKPAGKSRTSPAEDMETPARETSFEQADEDSAVQPAAGTAPQDVGNPAPGAPSPKDTLTLDKYVCFALYSANHAMHGVYKTLLKEVGLTYPQLLAMTVLWETNNVPVGAITSKLQLDTNTLTPLLKRLEAMGLVTRTRNTKDERQVILKLTRKGRALQKKTEHFGHCIYSATGLSLEEVTDLQEKIMKLRDNLRQAELD